MDGSKFISCLLLLISASTLSTQTPVEVDNALEGGDAIEVEDTTAITAVTAEGSTSVLETFETEGPPRQKNVTTNSPCSSARNSPGRCVARQQCEYSTAAIDFTLYAPKGYNRTCSSEEVCCPLEALAAIADPPTASQPAGADDNLDFDADDD